MKVLTYERKSPLYRREFGHGDNMEGWRSAHPFVSRISLRKERQTNRIYRSSYPASFNKKEYQNIFTTTLDSHLQYQKFFISPHLFTFSIAETKMPLGAIFGAAEDVVGVVADTVQEIIPGDGNAQEGKEQGGSNENQDSGNKNEEVSSLSFVSPRFPALLLRDLPLFSAILSFPFLLKRFWGIFLMRE